MTDDQLKALESDPVWWLGCQIEHIMGAEGGDYWCEPVSILMAVRDIIKADRAKMEAAKDALS